MSSCLRRDAVVPKYTLVLGRVNPVVYLRGYSSMTTRSVSLDTLKLPWTMAITITYKGLLCWAPLPTAATRFVLRALFLALESAFSISFGPCILRRRTTACPNTSVLGKWKTSIMMVLLSCCHSREGCRRGHSRPNY